MAELIPGPPQMPVNRWWLALAVLVVGGLSLSAVLTLAIVPPLLALTVGVFERRRNEADARDSAALAHEAPGRAG